MRVFVELESELKPRFLYHEDLKVWFLTDLAQGVIREPPEPLL